VPAPVAFCGAPVAFCSLLWTRMNTAPFHFFRHFCDKKLVASYCRIFGTCQTGAAANTKGLPFGSPNIALADSPRPSLYIVVGLLSTNLTPLFSRGP